MTEQGIDAIRYSRMDRRCSDMLSSNSSMQGLMDTENKKRKFNTNQILIGTGIIVILITVVATSAILLSKGNISVSGLNVSE